MVGKKLLKVKANAKLIDMDVFGYAVDIWLRHWKKLVFIPAILFVLSLFLFAYNQYRYDSFMKRSVELTGGKVITITYSSLQPGMERYASSRGYQLRFIGSDTLTVEIPYNENATSVIDELKEYVEMEDYSVREIGPVLGEAFWTQSQTAILVALVFISIMVFLLFRSFVPSMAVISSIVIDAALTLAIISLLGKDFSIAMIGALLTIMSFSIDTDVLLTAKLTKTRSGFREAMKDAMRTATIIIIASLASAITVYVVSTNQVLDDIALVLIIGLAVDFVVTWFQNAGIIKWWVDGKTEKDGQ